ncbi:MAG: glycosyltransferase family 9 protein, partial [Bacteroidaceae bacterium]|nr:glycosyltransferase family 9 protein [Bacteroidaceae bacterium]
MKHLLIIRFSAMGDILMLVPIVEALALRYPDLCITVASRPMVESVFRLLPRNVNFIGINPKDYRGFRGVWKIFRILRDLNPTHVADMHDVLRTKLLRHGFFFTDVRMNHIVKDRSARRAFLAAPVKSQQETSFERYAKVLKQLGFPVTYDSTRPAIGSLIAGMPAIPLPPIADGRMRVGIAPFAAHEGKIYPMEKMEEVIRRLTAEGHQVFLFGAGEKEASIIDGWVKQYEGAHSVVSTQPNMAGELKMMSQMNVILTMDSGNMHLAALSGRPVVSIWGATHPLG